MGAAAAAIVKVVEHLGDGGGRKEIGLNPGGGALCLVGTFSSVLRNNVGSSIGEVAARRIPPRQGVAFIKHTLGWPHPSGCKTGEKPPVKCKEILKTQKLQFLVLHTLVVSPPSSLKSSSLMVAMGAEGCSSTSILALHCSEVSFAALELAGCAEAFF